MTREEAIESVKSAFDAWEYQYDTGDDWSREHEARDMAIKALEQEPIKGEWQTKFHGFPPEPTTICSECGFDRDFYVRSRGFDKIKYCPNCGAKMEVEE